MKRSSMPAEQGGLPPKKQGSKRPRVYTRKQLEKALRLYTKGEKGLIIQMETGVDQSYVCRIVRGATTVHRWKEVDHKLMIRAIQRRETQLISELTNSREMLAWLYHASGESVSAGESDHFEG